MLGVFGGLREGFSCFVYENRELVILDVDLRLSGISGGATSKGLYDTEILRGDDSG